jgi:hypothetical protein
MMDIVHHLFCPVHGLVVMVAVACPFALACIKLAIYKLKGA